MNTISMHALQRSAGKLSVAVDVARLTRPARPWRYPMTKAGARGRRDTGASMRIGKDFYIEVPVVKIIHNEAIEDITQKYRERHGLKW